MAIRIEIEATDAPMVYKVTRNGSIVDLALFETEDGQAVKLHAVMPIDVFDAIDVAGALLKASGFDLEFHDNVAIATMSEDTDDAEDS